MGVTNKAPPLRSHIAIEDEVEAKYWMKHLGITRDELQRVVEKVQWQVNIHDESAASWRSVKCRSRLSLPESADTLNADIRLRRNRRKCGRYRPPPREPDAVADRDVRPD